MASERGDGGAVLLAVLLAVALMAAIAASVVRLRTTDLRVSFGAEARARAVYLAEAGIADALDRLADDARALDGVGTIRGQWGDGTWEVQVVSWDGWPRLQATGQVGAVRRTVDARFRFHLPEALDKALFVERALLQAVPLAAETEVYGDAYIGGALQLAAPAAVRATSVTWDGIALAFPGTVFLGAPLDTSGLLTADGSIVITDAPWAIPVPDKARLRELAAAEGNLLQGTQVWSGTTTRHGVVYVEAGDLFARGQFRGRATVFVEGNVCLQRDFTYADGDSLLWIIAGEGSVLEVEQGARVDAFLQGLGPAVEIVGGCGATLLPPVALPTRIVGGVAATDLVYEGGLRVQVEPRLRARMLPGVPVDALELLTWEQD